MKQKGFLLIIMIACLALKSCKTSERNDTENIISVTILPQKYFAEKIAGNDYKINVLVPSGASPESYEPSPRNVQDLYLSDVYFLIGEFPIEKSWIADYRRNNASMPFFDLSKGIEFIQSMEEHEGHHHYGADPHIWLSPMNALIMSNNMLNGLINVFPHDSIRFRENYQELIMEIRQIDTLYRNSADKLHELNFLIYHPALGYLARDYGMKQHVLEFEGKEPPPSHIASIVEEAKKQQIHFIFVQRQFSMDNARSIAREIDARIIQIDPLSSDWPGELKKIHSHLME